ncbi:sulfatase-like hydrolase/transferase [Rhodobacteraceae bacterium KMM 6894]|nr:sulfatase-like hydrolase/transferase [Rhodobacteraceae bacterium KMM 6894]
MADPQNVLLLVVDQMRADVLHGALAGHVDLPNLREFAADSIDFRRHFSAANPCGPSRASLLTGQFAMNHRAVRNTAPLAHDTPSLPMELRKAGYLPLLFGYTDTAQDPRIYPEGDPALTSYHTHMLGFQEVVEMRYGQSKPWLAHLRAQGYEFANTTALYTPVAAEGRTASLNGPALYKAAHSDTAYLTNRFLDHMPTEEGAPWFAHLTYIRPHPPLVAPRPYNKMYKPADMPLPVVVGTMEDEREKHPFLAPMQNHLPPKKMVKGFKKVPRSDKTHQTLRAVYLGLAAEVDAHIGRVLRYLKESGQYDNTMIIITADHGEMLGDRHTWGKHSVYDAAYHIPLMIRVPGSTPAVINAPTQSTDIAPTVLEWLGRDVPNAMDGRSLLGFLTGQPPKDWRDYSYSELDFGLPGGTTVYQNALGTTASESNLSILRGPRYTLVEFACDLPPMLFDFDGKGEAEDVAAHPDHQTALYQMARRMLRHRMRAANQTLALTSITANGPVSDRRLTD